MEEAGGSGGGLFASFGRLFRTVVAIVHNRLELFLVELAEERWKFFDLLLLAGVALMLAGMGLMVATVTIVVLCLKANRLDWLVVLMLVYFAGALVGFWRLRKRLKGWNPFPSTLAEIKKDKACLEEKS